MPRRGHFGIFGGFLAPRPVAPRRDLREIENLYRAYGRSQPMPTIISEKYQEVVRVKRVTRISLVSKKTGKEEAVITGRDPLEEYLKHYYNMGLDLIAKEPEIQGGSMPKIKDIRFKIEFKRQPRPPFSKWEQVILADMDTGKYPEIIWNKEYWNISGKLKHYTHVDQTGTKVRFVKSAKDGEALRWTLMKPGRYLEKFYKDILTQKQRKYWEEHFNFSHEIPDCHITTDPHVIGMVYAKGPSSCMVTGAPFNTHLHPGACYGSSDLALAYIMKKGNKEVSARTVVNTKKKLYGRPYGDANRLDLALQALGYTSSHDGDSYNKCLIGAKIAKIPNLYNHQFLMPFIDASQYAINEIPGNEKELMIVPAEKGRVPERFKAKGGQVMAGRCQGGLQHWLPYSCEFCKEAFATNPRTARFIGADKNPKFYCGPCYKKNVKYITHCENCENTVAFQPGDPRGHAKSILISAEAGGKRTCGPFCDYCYRNYTFTCDGCYLPYSTKKANGRFDVGVTKKANSNNNGLLHFCRTCYDIRVEGVGEENRPKREEFPNLRFEV